MLIVSWLLSIFQLNAKTVLLKTLENSKKKLFLGKKWVNLQVRQK